MKYSELIQQVLVELRDTRAVSYPRDIVLAKCLEELKQLVLKTKILKIHTYPIPAQEGVRRYTYPDNFLELIRMGFGTWNWTMQAVDQSTLDPYYFTDRAKGTPAYYLDDNANLKQFTVYPLPDSNNTPEATRTVTDLDGGAGGISDPGSDITDLDGGFGFAMSDGGFLNDVVDDLDGGAGVLTDVSSLTSLKGYFIIDYVRSLQIPATSVENNVVINDADIDPGIPEQYLTLVKYAVAYSLVASSRIEEDQAKAAYFLNMKDDLMYDVTSALWRNRYGSGLRPG